MNEVIAYLVGLLIIQPLEARLAEKLEGARVPPGIVAEVESCARSATPALVDRVTSDPLWALQTGIRVWVGTATPEAVLVEAAPRCRPAVEAAQPFLQGREA